MLAGRDVVDIAPVRAVYEAGDPREATTFSKASLPPDRAADLLAGGPLQPEDLTPWETRPPLDLEGARVDVITTGDGHRWCIDDEATVSFDCLLAYQLVATDDVVQSLSRVLHYPERTVLVLEVVNDGAEAQLPVAPTLPDPFTELAGPARTLSPDVADRWLPGTVASWRWELDNVARSQLFLSPPLTLSAPWGEVLATPFEPIWVLGPRAGE